MLELGLKLTASALALTAMITDLRSRRIPNALAVGLAILALGLSLVTSSKPGALECGLVLVVGFTLFACRALGGGDVKFMAAGALMLPGNLGPFVFLTALFGGVLTLAVLVLRVFRERRDDTVPYGIAIACAFLACLWFW